MANLFDYIKGQGKIFLADRDVNGNPVAPWLWIGDCPDFQMGQAPEEQKVKENYTGFRGNALTLITGLDTTFQFTLRNIEPKIFALMTAGVVLDVAQATITNEAFPSGLVVGDTVLLKTPGKVTALTVQDNLSAPLTLGTHYTHDGYGQIVILNLASFTQPLKASTYTVATKKEVPIQNQAVSNKYLWFKGVNTARKLSGGGFPRMDLLLYNCSMKPAESIGFIQQDNIAEITLGGSFDIDTTKAQTSSTSQYGTLVYPDGI